MNIETTHDLIEDILSGWKVRIGGDYPGYRGHVCCMFNFCLALHLCTEEEKTKLEIAACFHVLKFHKISMKDGSGECEIAETGNPEDKVFVVLYELRTEALEAHDRYEGQGYGYERKRIVVTAESGKAFNAETYVATRTNPGIRPYSWYKEHVLKGAKTNGLPEANVSLIHAVVGDMGPDEDRHSRELAVYSEPLHRDDTPARST